MADEKENLDEEFITLPPHAKTLLKSLRSIGYSFADAISDIIDNSISAEADTISIDFDSSCSEPYLSIFDNGIGMGREDLLNAMLIGSDRGDKDDVFSEFELGRFGMGMKSASFSQCRKLIVASKDKNSRYINAMSYDLDIIERKDTWLVHRLSNDEIDNLPNIDLLKNVKSGTIVIWEDFDKLKAESGKGSFADAFEKAMMGAKKQIELVFHRFYDSIIITFNGNRIKRRDPFLTGSPKTQIGREHVIPYYGETITIIPYTLPHFNTLNSVQKELLGLDKEQSKISDEQGLYIYRNKRLIQWGSWFRLGVKAELNKLARVQVDIPSSLDDVWRIDVKKSSTKIPDDLQAQIRISIDSAIKKSRNEIKHRGKREQAVKNAVWIRQPGNESVEYLVNREYPYLVRLKELLNSEEKALLETYLKAVEQCIPLGSITDDNAEVIRITNSSESLENDELANEVVDLGRKLNLPNKAAVEYVVSGLLDSEGFSQIQDRKAEIVERIFNGKK